MQSCCCFVRFALVKHNEWDNVKEKPKWCNCKTSIDPNLLCKNSQGTFEIHICICTFVICETKVASNEIWTIVCPWSEGKVGNIHHNLHRSCGFVLQRLCFQLKLKKNTQFFNRTEREYIYLSKKISKNTTEISSTQVESRYSLQCYFLNGLTDTYYSIH